MISSNRGCNEHRMANLAVPDKQVALVVKGRSAGRVTVVEAYGAHRAYRKGSRVIHEFYFDLTYRDSAGVLRHRERGPNFFWSNVP